VVVPQNVELCLTVASNEEGLVLRTGAGQCQETRPSTGDICLSPVGVGDNQITITAPIPRTLHLYLPTAQFRKLADDFNLPGAPARSIRYVAGVRDQVIYQIGLSIISAMTNETAAGRMFVETASATLAACLLQKYCDTGACKSLEPATHRIDHAAVIGPLIPPAKRGGNKRTVNEREVVNGLMYTLSTGCQWAALPKDLPPRNLEISAKSSRPAATRPSIAMARPFPQAELLLANGRFTVILKRSWRRCTRRNAPSRLLADTQPTFRQLAH
jgi:transposase